jgi:hypothetical protein
MALTAGPQLVWPRPSPNNQPPAEHTVDPSYVHFDPCTTHWQQLRGSPQTSTYRSSLSKMGSTQVIKTMNTHGSQAYYRCFVRQHYNPTHASSHGTAPLSMEGRHRLQPCMICSTRKRNYVHTSSLQMRRDWSGAGCDGGRGTEPGQRMRDQARLDPIAGRP